MQTRHREAAGTPAGIGIALSAGMAYGMSVTRLVEQHESFARGQARKAAAKERRAADAQARKEREERRALRAAEKTARSIRWAIQQEEWRRQRRAVEEERAFSDGRARWNTFGDVAEDVDSFDGR